MIQKKNSITSRKSSKLFLGLLLVILLAVTAGTSAKYIQKKTNIDNTGLVDFYFTSTLLSEEGASYTLMPNITKLDIPLCNYEDDLQVSTEDISYSYTVTRENQELKKGTGSIQAGEMNTATISLADLTAGTYKVTVSATSPFSATLKGTFVIPEESDGIGYSVSDQADSPYALVTVWTENYKGNIQLTWPAGVIPDSTDTQLEEVKTYAESENYNAGKVMISGEAYSSHVYRFFKKDSSMAYSEEQFTATKASQ